MPISVEMTQKGDNTRVFDVTVPSEDVAEAFTQAVEKLQQQVSLPGFRKGKVPKDVISKKYVQEIRDEVFENLFARSYPEALEQTRSVPIDRPRLEKMTLDEGQPLAYQVVVDVLPAVKVSAYRGLKLQKKKIQVTDQDVAEVLEKLRQQQALLEPVADRPAQAQDLATVEYTGRLDGQVISGAQASNQMVELGSGQTLPDFEQAILGMRPEETKQFPVAFPADYHAPDVAGKTLEFTLTLKGLQQKKLPELDDALAQQMGQFQNLDELKTRIRADLTAEKERQNRLLLQDGIMKELGKTTQVKVPQVLVDRSLKSLYQEHRQRAAQFGRAEEPEEPFKSKHRESVDFELRARLALREIALLENLAVSQEEINLEVERLARGARQSADVIRAYLTRNQGWEDLRDRLRDEKTLDVIIANAKINEVQ
ncbi:MAG: trigger factor [candidate division FCPU426 bacterium]